MQLTWLKAFHVVASHGGFTAASRVLNVSQPTVSSQVKALEQYYGVELFFRHGHRVELAPLGKSLHLITAGLFGHEEEAAGLLRSAKTLGLGELRLAAVGPYDVMKLAASVKRKFPALQVSVSLAHSPEVLQQLEEFKSDIAILAHRPTSPQFHVAPFARHRAVVIASPDHRLSKKRSRAISIQDLAGERSIMRESTSTTRKAFEQACKRARISTEVVMELNSREAVIEAVALGLGISVVAEPELHRHPKLRTIEISDAEMYIESYVVCLAERRDRPLIKLFFELAREMASLSGAVSSGSKNKS